MLYRVVTTTTLSLFFFLSSDHPKKLALLSLCPTENNSAIRKRGVTVAMSLQNDNAGDGWESVPKKKRNRNRKASTKNNTAKGCNPYVEVIDVSTIDQHTSDPSSTVSETETGPFMVLLVGLIGSGKSTFAQTLVASMPDKFCRINQDELKTRPKCERKLKQVLSESPRLCPIIDRCNFDSKQRSTWYQLAEEAVSPSTSAAEASSETTMVQSMRLSSGIPVDVVVLDLPYEECLRRCGTRKGHETIKSPQQAAGVLKQLQKQWSPPHHAKNASEKSKYRSLTIVRTEKERKECLLRILRQAR